MPRYLHAFMYLGLLATNKRRNYNFKENQFILEYFEYKYSIINFMNNKQHITLLLRIYMGHCTQIGIADICFLFLKTYRLICLQNLLNGPNRWILFVAYAVKIIIVIVVDVVRRCYCYEYNSFFNFYFP